MPSFAGGQRLDLASRFPRRFAMRFHPAIPAASGEALRGRESEGDEHTAERASEWQAGPRNRPQWASRACQARAGQRQNRVNVRGLSAGSDVGRLRRRQRRTGALKRGPGRDPGLWLLLRRGGGLAGVPRYGAPQEVSDLGEWDEAGLWKGAASRIGPADGTPAASPALPVPARNATLQGGSEITRRRRLCRGIAPAPPGGVGTATVRRPSPPRARLEPT